MPTVIKKLDAGAYQLKDQVVGINRVTKVVKGGKNMSFAALVVVGDPSAGVVGFGSGKAKEVPQAIRKGIESAKKNLIKVNLTQTSIAHLVLGRYGSGKVLLKPAPEGTGVIAGGAVRAVMTSAGVTGITSRCSTVPRSRSRIRADPVSRTDSMVTMSISPTTPPNQDRVRFALKRTRSSTTTGVLGALR